MHVFVTGASAGIGEAIAREFARGGARLSLVARRRERLERLAAELGGEAAVVPADLAGPGEGLRALAEAERSHGPVDVLVNNAAALLVARIERTDPVVAERLLAVNLSTPLALMRAVAPRMIERGAGSIVNVVSTAALAPTPGMFVYNASKAGLAAASESLHGELRASGVHVLTVYPGPISTDMIDEALRSYGRRERYLRHIPIGDAATLARRIRTAVRRREARLVYPRLYNAMRLFPSTLRWALDRFAPLPDPDER